jgi:hypothetical protein
MYISNNVETPSRRSNTTNDTHQAHDCCCAAQSPPPGAHRTDRRPLVNHVVLIGALVGCSSKLRAGHHCMITHTPGVPPHTKPGAKPDAARAACGSPGTAVQCRHSAHTTRAPGTKWALLITFSVGQIGSCPAGYHRPLFTAAAIFGIDACHRMLSAVPAKHISSDCRLADRPAAHSAAAAPKHSSHYQRLATCVVLWQFKSQKL